MSQFNYHLVEGVERRTSDVAIELIRTGRQRGILVFESNAEAVASTVSAVRETLRDDGEIDYETDPDNYTFRIYTLFGGSSETDILETITADPDKINLLVSANIMENGPDLPWADAGISSGISKRPVKSTTGTHHMEEYDTPYWKICRQISKTCRFRSAPFFLCSSLKLEERTLDIDKDINRLPIGNFIVRLGSLGISINDLEFPKAEIPHPKKLKVTTTHLKRLGAIEVDPLGDITVTDTGKISLDMNIGHRAAAAFAMAKKLDILEDALPVILVIELGDIRRHCHLPLGGGFDSMYLNLCPTSDVISAAMLIETAHYTRDFVSGQIGHDKYDFKRTFHRMAMLGRRNINLRRFRDYMSLVWRMKHLGVYKTDTANPIYVIDPRTKRSPLSDNPELITKLKTVVAASRPDEIFFSDGTRGFQGLGKGDAFWFDRTSIASLSSKAGTCGVAAHRVVIKPRAGEANTFVIGRNLTFYNESEMAYALGHIPEDRLQYLN